MKSPILNFTPDQRLKTGDELYQQYKNIPFGKYTENNNSILPSPKVGINPPINYGFNPREGIPSIFTGSNPETNLIMQPNPMPNPSIIGGGIRDRIPMPIDRGIGGTLPAPITSVSPINKDQLIPQSSPSRFNNIRSVLGRGRK